MVFIFTSQYVVESYRVRVSPVPSSCSGEQVLSHNEDYSCSGLDLGTRYSFTVSACHQLWEPRRNKRHLDYPTTR